MALVARWRRARRCARRSCSPPRGCSPSSHARVLLTGFPWVASGYAYVDSPLAGFAPWLGVYGIGALAAGARRTLRLRRPAPCARLDRAGQRARDRARRRRAARPGRLLDADAHAHDLAAAGQRPAGGEVRRRPSRRRSRRDGGADRGGARRARRRPGDGHPGPVLASSTTRGGEALLERFRAPGRAAILGMPIGDAGRGYTNSAIGISAEASAHAGRASTATTSTTSSRSASSCRRAFTGSRA